jgi:hypothetical protein
MSLLIASDPQQLVAAQHALIGEMQTKIEAALGEARDAKEMRQKMLAAGLNPSQAKSIHGRATARVVYLTKIKDALQAGYVLMPDMPGEVIAVRTDRVGPSPAARRHHPWHQNVPRELPQNLPSGQGYYVSPRQNTATSTSTHTGSDGKLVKNTYRYATSLRDPDGLDRRFVKPAVIDRMSAAMLTNIFDEIVTVRGAGFASRAAERRKDRDPIVLGRVVDQRNKSVSAFLIAWFVDTEEL